MRRLLVIAPTFFPNPAVSSIRATELCRHLPALGWEPVVITRAYGFHDQPPGISTHYLDAPSPAARALEGTLHAGSDASSLKASARGWLIKSRWLNSLAVPDLSIRFWTGALPAIEKIAVEERVDAVFTTSPPHSIHAAGLHLRRRLGLPWIADFRDPYTNDLRFRPTGLGLLRLEAHRRFEAAIHAEASRITYAIPAHQRWARRAFPAAASKQVLVRNGFPARLAPRSPDLAAGGRIAVIGSSGAAEMVQIARTIAQLRRDGSDVQLRHCGAPLGNEAELKAILGDAGVFRGRLPHDEALEEMRTADVLIACHPWERERNHGLTSRLFEYLAVGVPVIMINPVRGDRPFLRRFASVRRLYRPGVDAIAAAIGAGLAQEIDRAALDEYRAAFGREAQARLLAEALDAVAGPITSPATQAAV